MATHDVLLRINTSNGHPHKWEWQLLIDEEEVTVLDWGTPDLEHEDKMQIIPEIRYA
tara:strand:- start:198 stop:368 length:171 start_codon:yes stop_codon:yes gene_type:complete